MTEQAFSNWGIVFALSAATAALTFAIIVFHAMIEDKKAGIPVIIAFALIGIAKLAKYYLLSAIAVVLMIPFIAYFSFKHWKKPIIWINWSLFFIAAPLAFYAYRILYIH